jgi:hypothetical protein
MLTSIQRRVLGTVKCFGALALGGAILWQVVAHADLQRGIAYVHVSNTKVSVTIDDEIYWVETVYDSPIVCELGPGRHTLRMLRSGQVVFEEEFTLDMGQEVVLTAWERVNENEGELQTAMADPRP